MPVSGFIAPGEELPGAEAEAELRALTQQVFELEAITKGTYILNEEDLPNKYKELLHNRAYVKDLEEITETSSGTPRTFYIAADKAQGLIVPARSISINNSGPSDVYYRWTDDGERWTDWITMEDCITDEYDTVEKCRFAEIQVYSLDVGSVISLRATR